MIKETEGKLKYYTVLSKYDLALKEIVKRATQGHIKYFEHDKNWDNFKTVDPEEYLDAALRHLLQCNPDETDEELTSLTNIETTHAVAAAWNLIAYIQIKKENELRIKSVL